MAEWSYPAANSDHSTCSSKTKLFHVEFSDLHISEEDSIKPGVINSSAYSSKRNTSLMKTLFFVPADVAAIVHLSQKETLRAREIR
jgi:hypothetical protein